MPLLSRYPGKAGRVRTSKTEYISLVPAADAPSTTWKATIARIKAATGHLKGLKIGIMGCIVNGPEKWQTPTTAMWAPDEANQPTRRRSVSKRTFPKKRR